MKILIQRKISRRQLTLIQISILFKVILSQEIHFRKMPSIILCISKSKIPSIKIRFQTLTMVRRIKLISYPQLETKRKIPTSPNAQT